MVVKTAETSILNKINFYTKNIYAKKIILKFLYKDEILRERDTEYLCYRTFN